MKSFQPGSHPVQVPVGRRALGILIGLFIASCGSAVPGATQVHLDRAGNQSPKGRQLFLQQCAACHGTRGEGATAPPIMGPTALNHRKRRHTRSLGSSGAQGQLPGQTFSQPPVSYYEQGRSFQSAMDVFTYVSTKMPRPSDRAGSLSQPEYWAIVSYVLAAHGVPLPQEGVRPENADRISLP